MFGNEPELPDGQIEDDERTKESSAAISLGS